MTSVVDDISYEDLYARWERGNWEATEIDFSVDRRHWHEELTPVQRRAAVWNYALFMHGEHVVASTLGPYIDAAPRPEQKYFLATQQVDEARHSVFFGRFLAEVVEAGDGVDGALAATQPELTWGFRKVFGRLEKMAHELRRDPSRPRLAAAIALYHLIVEGTLAQPGQHFIERYLDERGLLPGFHAGMRNVSLDEQRHIAFGMKMLAELCRDDPASVRAVTELIDEVSPWALAVFMPPGLDPSYTECFGFTLLDIYEEGARSFEAKLRVAGLESVLEVLPLAKDATPRARAERLLGLLRAGMLGEGGRPIARDPDSLRLLFEATALGIDPARAPAGGMTIQWELDDADPWHVVVDGMARAVPGRAAGPDVVLGCALADWVDVFAGRVDPARQLLRRRLRPRGSPLALLAMRRVFVR